MRIIIAIVGVLLLIQFVIITDKPVHNSIKYPQEFDEILGRLGGGTHENTSVILFADSHCTWSNQLENDMKDCNIPYFRADVKSNGTAREIHQYLGKNILGIISTLATPTSLVGTKVVRGANIGRIRQEIERIKGKI